MSASHLNVPPVHTAHATDTATGRPRSGSQRSQHSQHSNVSHRSHDHVVNSNSDEDVDFGRQPTIRIQRQASRQSVRNTSDGYFNQQWPVLRRRSTSEPSIRDFGTPAEVTTPRPARQSTYMPDILENTPSQNFQDPDSIQPVPSGGARGSPAQAQPQLRRAGPNIAGQDANNGMYENQLVDLLDLVDPEVSTLTTLTNVQNSLFVPDLGRYVNRRPTYTLTRPGRTPTATADGSTAGTADGAEDSVDVERSETAQERPPVDRTTTSATLNTITSRVNEKYFAVLPHGVRLSGWSEEDKLELNDHVRHMLHSRRSKFKRSMKGFGQYVRKPLGFFVTLYATLITLFGLAWVLFLIGWIYVDGRQEYIIHIIDSVLVALFAIVGDGLAPFRAVDTYHMCYIAHYHHLTWRLRREKSLPKLQNRSDLPGLAPNINTDVEKQEYSVLSPEQQKKLEHHQKKFSKSHSFYKPHETTTHQAFSLRLLVAIVVLLDCHSLLQISLGACTWGISYHVRPFALTTVILCCSITCNITAGVLISVGDHRSRKKDVIEKMFRQQLTEEAIEKVEAKKRNELKRDLEKKGLASELLLRQELSEAALPTHTKTDDDEKNDGDDGKKSKSEAKPAPTA